MPRTPGEDPKFGLVYSGSLGTWYMVREMVAFARSAAKFVPGPTLFLTPDTDEAHQAGITSDWAELRTVQPDSVGGWLRLARASFFFIRPIPSKRASSPTKLAEALACGLPIVCNRGIGTLEEIIEKERVGVFVDSFSESAYVEAAQRLQNLLRDRELPERCRRLAEVRYSLKAGVEAYEQLYRGLTEPPGDSVRRP